MHVNNYSLAVRADPFESAKSHLFDTSSWAAEQVLQFPELLLPQPV
jgi:hypothetical protein